MVDPHNALARRGSIFFDEMIHQQGNVFLPLSQGGHANGNHVQAIIEIFAKSSFRYSLVQIAIGGGNHPHVNLDLAAATHWSHQAFL